MHAQFKQSAFQMGTVLQLQHFTSYFNFHFFKIKHPAEPKFYKRLRPKSEQDFKLNQCFAFLVVSYL